MKWLRCLGFALSLAGLTGTAFGHKASDSYLRLAVTDSRISGQWDIALRDLELIVGLDADGDGAITWDELRDRHATIAAHALGRLSIAASGERCTLAVTDHLVDRRSDGAYAVLRLAARCNGSTKQLAVGYDLMFDIDPLHRGLLRLDADGQTRSAVFAPGANVQRFEAGTPAVWHTFTQYLVEGVWHIWLGFDHLLFLLSLLLPVLLSPGGPPNARAGLRAMAWSAGGIVTAFTLAHSITLALATLGAVHVPARWAEIAIAASVVLVAALNLSGNPARVTRWPIAFVLGLIHGFGFANALAELDLPSASLALALFSFNLGVEAGQLAVVLAVLPLAYRGVRRFGNTRIALRTGSAAIGLLGALWLMERAFDLEPLGNLQPLAGLIR